MLPLWQVKGLPTEHGVHPLLLDGAVTLWRTVMGGTTVTVARVLVVDNVYYWKRNIKLLRKKTWAC